MKKIKKLVFAGGCFFALLLLFAAAWAAWVLSDLPDVTLLKNYRPPIASEVLDRNGAVITHIAEHKLRIWASISTVPDIVIKSVVIAEDDTFFGHKGINYKAVWDALKHDVQKKRFARGGSTITQQMIKNVFLSKEKTLSRKLREFILARRAEEILTKRQILEIYLNEVEWGDSIYGIEAASRYYFDKHAAELTAAEAALLAGMLPNPRYFDPFKRPDKARQRQEQVLFNMFQAKHLTDAEYADALAAPLLLRDPSSNKYDFSMLSGRRGRPCYLRTLEQIISSRFGETSLFRQGLRIRTTIDKSLQDSIFAAASDKELSSTPDTITAIMEGGEIRALSCALGAEHAMAIATALSTPSPVYDVVLLTPSAINPDMLIPAEHVSSKGETGKQNSSSETKE